MLIERSSILTTIFDPDVDTDVTPLARPGKWLSSLHGCLLRSGGTEVMDEPQRTRLRVVRREPCKLVNSQVDRATDPAVSGDLGG